MKKATFYIWVMSAALLVLGAALIFGACEQATGPGSGETVTELNLEDLVTAPAKGQIPITEIDGTQYSGTIGWRKPDGGGPSPDGFDAATIYIASIALTAKTGFTFSGGRL
jgi:hypothetical protein